MEGKTISHFRIESRIGEGGMGVVYKAEDVKLGRAVALKVLPPHLMKDPERTARFVKEARAAAAVTHPSIATIHEIDEAEGVTFIAMELVEGRTLRSMIQGEPLPVREAIRIATQVAQGLAAAHQRNIVHRDLKPENVIVTEDGQVKIIDFGLARLLEGARPTSPVESAPTALLGEARTQEGQVLGTPTYMSPEQARGQVVDYRTDLFSFGSTLYEMLTGRPPFKGATTTDTLSDILNKEPVPSASLNPEVPSSMQWVLDKCLEKDVKGRYQDTRDLVVDLQHIYPGLGDQTVSRAWEAGTPATSSVAPTVGGTASLLKKSLWVAAPVLLFLLALLTVPRLIQRSTAPPLPTPKSNSLAVFSFENLKDPDDPERLGQIMQELLITDLSGAGPLKIFSSQRLFDIQKQLQGGSEPESHKEFATAVATRAGAQNMLTGSLSQLGDRWILTTQLAEVGSGTVIQSKRIDGTDLFAMADQLTELIIDDLPVLIPEEAPSKISVREKTTSSLEAYQSYLTGIDLLNDEQYDGAAQELERAIEIDPTFGQAYLRLAVARWWGLDSLQAAREPLEKLLSGKVRLSEKERRMAEGTLAMVTQQFGEGVSAFEQLTQDYPDEKEFWYGLSEVLFHFPGGGREEEAVAAMEKAAVLDPDFTLAYKHIFDYYRLEKKYDEAVARGEALVRQNPDKAIWHRYYAAALELSGDETRTEEAIKQALRVNTTPRQRQELYSELAIAARDRFEPQRQAAYLRRALEANPGQDSKMLRGLLLENLGQQRKFEELKEVILQGLEENPASSTYLSFLFGVYQREWRFEEALNRARELAQEHPEDPQWYRFWLQFAIALDDESDTATAMTAAEQRHQGPDERRNLYLSLGGAHWGRGDFHQAIEYFRQAVLADPDREYADLLWRLGILHVLLGDLDAAQSWLDRGLEANPKHPGVLLSRMYLELERENFDEAIGYADQALEIFPRAGFTHRFRVYGYIRAGRIERAQELVESAWSLLPTPEARWSFLADWSHGVAWSFLAAGETNRAEVTFVRAGGIDPEPHPTVLAGLGFVHLSRGDVAHAEQTFRQALEHEPRNAFALQGFAAIRLAQGEWEEAEQQVRRQMKNGPVTIGSYELLACALAGQGRFEEARKLAEKMVAMDSSRASKQLLAWILVSGELDVPRGTELAQEALRTRPLFFDPGQALPHRERIRSDLQRVGKDP